MCRRWDRRARPLFPSTHCSLISCQFHLPSGPLCLVPYCALRQAAEAVGQRYVWAVDVGGDGLLLARLLSVVDGCIVADPARRSTIPRVLEALAALQRDASTGSGGGGGGSSSPVVPPPLPVAPPQATPTYDVLAIVDALEALAIDAVVVSAVANAIGTSLTSTLEVLSANKVPIMKTVAVKKALATCASAHPATTSVGYHLPAPMCRNFCTKACLRHCSWSPTVARDALAIVLQMSTVAVLETLEAMGQDADALETIGRRIIAADTVSVAELAAAGLSGRDIIAVRRALDPRV